MSFRNKVGAAIGGKPQLTFNSESLRRAGLQFVSTERMNQRTEELKSFNKALALKIPNDIKKSDEIFEWLVKQWYKIWNMYKENQMAWFRSGSNGPFGKMVSAIETMHEEIDVAIEANRSLLTKYTVFLEDAREKKDTAAEKKIEAKKMQLVRDFQIAYLVKLGYKYVGLQGNLCWLTEDVSIPESYPIMTTQPMPLTYPSTTMDHPKQLDGEKETQDWGKPKNDA